jgi:hypothetical protein
MAKATTPTQISPQGNANPAEAGISNAATESLPQVLMDIHKLLESREARLKKSRKKRLMHAGEKSAMFIREAVNIAGEDSRYLPGFISEERLDSANRDFSLFREIKAALACVNNRVNKISAVFDDEMCEYSYAINNLLKDSAKRGDPKAEAYSRRLSEYRPARGKKKVPSTELVQAE